MKNKKKNSIVIPASIEFEFGEVKLLSTHDKETLHIKNSKFNEVLKLKSDQITQTNRSIISNTFIHKDGSIHVTAKVGTSTLKSFFKELEKKITYFKKLDVKHKKQGLPAISGFFLHLSPEISFFVCNKR